MIAKTLEEAFYTLSPERDFAWEEGGGAALFIDPPGAKLGEALPARRPVHTIIARKLLGPHPDEKVFVTGQKGAGKSMTLARVYADPKVRERYEPLVVRAIEHLGRSSADIRLLLVVLIGRLAAFIDEHHLARPEVVAGEQVGAISRALSRWIGLFESGTATPPDAFQDVKAKLNAQVTDVTFSIVRDPIRRQQVLGDPRYSATELFRVTAALIEFVQHALAIRVDKHPGQLLLLIDDLDKYYAPEEVRSLFFEGFDTLRNLPCAVVLTFPYLLNFDDAFVRRLGAGEAQVIHNVKVVTREATADGLRLAPLDRRAALGPAQEFFARMYGTLVDATLLEGPEVIGRAAVLSAGIPREFLRVLSKGFELCLEYGCERLDLATLEAARIVLRQSLERTATRPADRARLKMVQWRGDILGFSSLLDSVHIVEYTNSNVWYAVHPLMEDIVEQWVARDRDLLLRKGIAVGMVPSELEAQWRKDAETE